MSELSFFYLDFLKKMIYWLGQFCCGGKEDIQGLSKIQALKEFGT